MRNLNNLAGDDKRRNNVGFALQILQRRLASSPAAIYHSLRRRRERLEARLADIEDLDARDGGRNVEVFLDVRIEGKPTPVTVKLSYEQASDLATLLQPFRKP
jgi:hypothetical protein